MDTNQTELFGEVPADVNPSVDFARFRVGKKIIHVPCSFWKDGRIRADLSKFGAKKSEVVSRNGTNLRERISEILQEPFGTIVEAIYEEFSRGRMRSTPAHPRLSNKRAATPKTDSPKRYINPFIRDVWTFSKAPEWLLARREPSAAEKLVYSRLTFSPREKETEETEKICKRKDTAQGVIFGLDQEALGDALGIRRETVNTILKSLERRGLIEYSGRQGAKGCVRFLWHEWIEGSCALNAQVSQETAVRSDHKCCSSNAQAGMRASHNSCDLKPQVSLDSEKRESTREERVKKPSRSWCNF